MTDRLLISRSPTGGSPPPPRLRVPRAMLAGIAAAALLAAAGCSSLPDPASVKLLPSTNAFVPTSSTEFAKSAVNTNRPVAATDLVDGQGACAGAVASSGEPGSIDRPLRGVGLDMTECEVVQIIGPAQSTQIGANARGERSVVMTYASAERSGIYRFTGGRLTEIERSGEPPPPERPAKKKPPPKRANPA
jgi:hypothetical protein